MSVILCHGFVAALLLAATSAVFGQSVLSTEDRIRLDALARQQAEKDAQTQAELRAAKAKLLRSAPLAAERNPLLGKWRVESAGRPRPKDELAQLFSMLNNPGGAMCEMLFGAGVTEFKPASWSSIDAAGDDSLGPIQYRGDSDTVWAVPESKAFHFFGFEFAGRDRTTVVGVEGCTLVRVGGTSARVAAGQVDPPAPPPTTGGQAGATVPQERLASAAPAPRVATAPRPPPEICRQTLVDKLGAVGVNDVTRVLDQRFKETLRGTAPHTQGLRLDARGSPCDDPRLNATLYDFDANGMLQSVTFVWARPAGPAPAPIFAERVSTLSRFHTLPAAQSTGRLVADTSVGRLVLQDMPERSLLLEAYSAIRPVR